TCGSKIFQNLKKSSKNPKFSMFARTLRARAGRHSSKISKNLPKSRKIFQNLEKSSKISKNLPESRKIFQESKIFKVCTNPSGTCGSKKSSKISKNLPK